MMVESRGRPRNKSTTSLRDPSSTRSSHSSDNPLRVDHILQKLRARCENGRSASDEQVLTEQEIYELCLRARELFMKEPTMLEVDAPVTVCGDIHGQLDDLKLIFDKCGEPSNKKPYLFLGDYVDRGRSSIECVCWLMALKLKHPRHVHILRGNHECRVINRIYGFFDECKRRYTVGLWRAFQDVFNAMPLCARVSKRIFCMHGGISQDLKYWSQLDRVKRPIDIPDSGILTDLVWADPDNGTEDYSPSPRGASYLFGTKAVERFCKQFDIDMIARAHQVVQDGYEFFADRRLVTVFSAPHYCGEFENAAAVMHVDGHLCCKFTQFRPTFDMKSLKRSNTTTTAADDKTQK